MTPDFVVTALAYIGGVALIMHAVCSLLLNWMPKPQDVGWLGSKKYLVVFNTIRRIAMNKPWAPGRPPNGSSTATSVPSRTSPPDPRR